MTKVRYVALVVRGLSELIRYDVVHTCLGFRGISKRRPPLTSDGIIPTPESVSSICSAVLVATCLYWKPVLCLQRSICTVWLLRRHGVPGYVVVGYRPQPFFSHAWVEVDGRVVNDSPAYQERLRVLFTVCGADDDN